MKTKRGWLSERIILPLSSGGSLAATVRYPVNGAISIYTKEKVQAHSKQASVTLMARIKSVTPKNGDMFMGQKVLFRTTFFNRSYFWMRDPEGTIYLVGEKNGLPDLS